MNILIGSDHGGLNTKRIVKEVLIKKGINFTDIGTTTADSTDYPDYAGIVAGAIERGEAELGILICTSGIGMSIAANRFPHVRAAFCNDAALAAKSKEHNNSNILVLGETRQPESEVVKIVENWLNTEFSGETRHQTRINKATNIGNRIIEIAHLKEEDKDVYDAIAYHASQEKNTINLIASENLVSRAVRAAQGSVLTNKYAEGYPGKRWYSGCEYVDQVERLAIQRAKELFGADHANVQPHCGSSANMAVYFAILNPGDTILSMSLDQGGHLTHGSPVNFSGRLFNIVPYRVDQNTERLDYDALKKQALEARPKLIVAGASAYPRALDFAEFRKIADACGAMLLVDMAHIAGLVAGGAHESPVPYAEFVTSTTHKTLRGPRSGLVLCRSEFAQIIDKTVFPGLQGGPLMHTTAAKAVCFKEAMSPDFKDYANQIVANSKTLAETIAAHGFRLVSGGTDNHLMLVDVASSGLTGKSAAAALDETGIIVNKNTIPFDKNSPFVTSGIRIGTASVTTRGMKEGDMRFIGDKIAAVLENIGNEDVKRKIRQEISEFSANFMVP